MTIIFSNKNVQVKNIYREKNILLTLGSNESKVPLVILISFKVIDVWHIIELKPTCSMQFT